MVLLSILNGAKAGQNYVARHFPFQVGRAAGAELVLEDDGVWERHLEIDFLPGDGFHLRAHPGALVSINSARTEQARLRNGDLLELGSVKVRFWLAPASQRSLRPRELLTWLALAGLLGFELSLIYFLLG